MLETRSDGELLVSYLTLRRVVGTLGVALPVVLALWGFVLCGCFALQPSISDYYALRTRDAFVGILFTIGWFLFTYRGYDRRDDIAGNLACLFALGVALSPNKGASSLESTIHFVSAAALFSVLSYFSLVLFTKSAGNPTPRKLIRNHVYRICGMVMVGCILAIALLKSTMSDATLDSTKLVFWLESLALWAFGFSWFVKGEAILKDT